MIDRGVELRVLRFTNEVSLDWRRMHWLDFRCRWRLSARARRRIERTWVGKGAAQRAFPEQGAARNLLLPGRFDDDIGRNAFILNRVARRGIVERSRKTYGAVSLRRDNRLQRSLAEALSSH